MLPLTIGQNTTISHLQCQTFQHIGKEADLMWSQEASSKGVFTLSLWMHKGSWGPPQWVGCDYGKWKSSRTMVSHIHPGSHSSAPTTDLHKILHSTPKGESQAGLLPLCSSNSTNSMEQDFGNLRVYFGTNEDVTSGTDWSSTSLPRADIQQRVAGWETHILELWSSTFHQGSGLTLQGRRFHIWRWFFLIPL